MVINAAVHYACLAMMDLAMHSKEGQPVRSAEITGRHDIPGPYLVQILRTLKSTGWVKAVRGAQGGYVLSVDPDSITLLDIVEAIGCTESTDRADQPASEAQQALQRRWNEAAEESRARLARVRLGDVVRECQDVTEPMFYI
ncbi:Rrf2 family transcriptional regulator [Rhodopirellula sp. JC740]|uniref:Rrf2 family transcriptional regulator n=1 Tax=Rhodopirellula halodulae TaxID=2894198 RepID=A0ABS8NFK6_9BACT|nr:MULTISPECIES: Rrf2 family transcriptional regulator [unclassified Rhodopirellula]MCC9641246.1 Rrf2 family transcriptional regulator [Rhodopirellula sp. JC740]MCC9657654.1 Rrf2 family transcriptional regulator [Rhodopirellula sp. JC737]